MPLARPIHQGARHLAVSLAITLLGACAGEPPSGASADPGYRSLPWSDGMLVDSAEAIAISRGVMGAGGCAPVIGRPPAGAVWVVLPQAPPQQFDCGQLSADSAQRLARAARTSVRSTGSGAHAYSDPGYWEITTEEVHSCSSTVPVSWSEPAMGTAHWIKVTLPDGETWEFWVEPGVTVAVRFVTCSWVEKISARKFDGGGTPLIPAPGEFPNPDGGGGPSQYPTNEPQLVSVAVTPGERTLPVGEIAQFQATLTYNNGAVVESAANVIWSSSSTIAIEDDKGTFQTNQEGLATITATLGSKTGSATLSILTDLSDFDEFVPELELDTLPNCGTLIPTDSSQGFAAQWAWCNRAVPPTDTIERNRIRDATAAIRAIGGVCVELANVIDSIMANNLLRIDHRKRGEIPYVAWTSRGDRGGSAMVLRGELVSTWYDNTPLAHPKGTWVTLQWALAHEADHATGASHTDHPTNMTTPRSNFCSGTAHLAPPP